MSDCITDDSVAEIYVEIHKSYGGVEQQDGPYLTKSCPIVHSDGDGQGGVDGDADRDGDAEGDNSEGFDPDEEEAETESHAARGRARCSSSCVERSDRSKEPVRPVAGVKSATTDER